VKILIVDDEPVLRKWMRRLLEHAGHTVVESGSALDAVRLLTAPVHEDATIQLALIDYDLRTTMSGVDVAHHCGPGTTPILMTGFGQRLRAEWTYRFLMKPVTWADLRQEIERVKKAEEDTVP
jgi:DNA-binding NtrC family response regulator